MSPAAPAAVSVALLAAAGPLESVATLPQALQVAAAGTLAVAIVGVVLLVGSPASTRAVRDDAVERPDLSFAVGFVVFFGVLVVAVVPLFVVTVVEHSAVEAIATFVALPGLVLWAGLLVVGAGAGAIVVGDRLVDRLGVAAPSLAWALAVGAVVVGASLLVPVLGALVAMGLATVATGAALRRRFDLDDRLFDLELPIDSTGAPVGRRSTEPDDRTDTHDGGWEWDTDEPVRDDADGRR